MEVHPSTSQLVDSKMKNGSASGRKRDFTDLREVNDQRRSEGLPKSAKNSKHSKIHIYQEEASPGD